MASPASTPEAPYYAVIFTSCRTDGDGGYAEMATVMENLAKKQPGYLGLESARSGLGITVSYWTDLDSIAAWKRNVDHVGAQKLGRELWYSSYVVRVAKVERQYTFSGR